MLIASASLTILDFTEAYDSSNAISSSDLCSDEKACNIAYKNYRHKNNLAVMST
jgi:hypothetical protein